MFTTSSKALAKSPLFELDQFDLLWKDLFNNESFFSDITNKISHPTDIYETEKGITFEVAVVGLDKNDLEISTETDTLRIKYTKQPENSQRSFVYRGIKRSSFDLAWRVSSKFDVSKLEARMERGLLIIEVPLAENKNSRKTIEIK